MENENNDAALNVKVKKFKVYADPGHAWCKVPMKLITSMGLVNKITRYSYVNGDSVFLEEDCDLTTFVKRWQELYPNVTIKFDEYRGNKQSRIRNYQRHLSKNNERN